jgi:hypothetical protein
VTAELKQEQSAKNALLLAASWLLLRLRQKPSGTQAAMYSCVIAQAPSLESFESFVMSGILAGGDSQPPNLPSGKTRNSSRAKAGSRTQRLKGPIRKKKRLPCKSASWSS